MALVEMVIDSVRRSMRNDEWVVLLKEKPTERYLPVYLDSSMRISSRRRYATSDVPERRLMPLLRQRLAGFCQWLTRYL